MSKKTHSQDFNFKEWFKKEWEFLDSQYPLTPKKELKNSYNAFIKAAESDGFMFGDYNAYDSYKEG